MRYKFFTALITALILMGTVSGSYAGGWLIYHKPEFKGKVIDSETKQPIEGAVVVAIYYKKSMMGIVESYSVIMNVKETLTDKNGEFYIPSYTTVIQPLSWESKATFIIFKPGYGSFPKNYEFMIYPVKNASVVKSVKWKTPQHRSVESIEQGIVEDGIIFWKPKWFKNREWNVNYRPFIPLNNAENRVKSLDIPFDYEINKDIDNVWRVWSARRTRLPEKFSNYTVVGLKKLTAWKERRKANAISISDIHERKWPLLNKAIKKENEWLKRHKSWRRGSE